MHIQLSKLRSVIEICQNEQSLNEIIWTLKCDKLHMFGMVDELKKKLAN